MVTVGGSECAAAAGVHPYTSRVMLWLRRTGRVEQPETEAMRWGTRIEPLVLAALEEEGYELLPAPADGFRRDWQAGHPDAFCRLGERERAVVEVKTTGQWAHRDGSVPVQYQAQCQWYMHLCDLDLALLAVLVGGQRLEVVELRRDQRAIDLLLELCDEWRGYVQRDQPPPPDGSASAREALQALYPQAAAGRRVRLLGDDWQALRELRELRAQRDVLDEQIAEREQRVKAAMGEAEVALSPSDVEVARWSQVMQRRLDTRALRAAHTTIADEYTIETTTRRFTLT